MPMQRKNVLQSLGFVKNNSSKNKIVCHKVKTTSHRINRVSDDRVRLCHGEKNIIITSALFCCWNFWAIIL